MTEVLECFKEFLKFEVFLGIIMVQEVFEKNAATRFWRHFEPYRNVASLEINNDPVSISLLNYLEYVRFEKEKFLLLK